MTAIPAETPSVPTAPISNPTRASVFRSMLSLPEPGHITARRWLYLGMAAYVVLAGVVMGTVLASSDSGIANGMLSLLGLGARRNWAVFVLVLSGIALTVIATFRVWRDIALMAREESDIDWVRRTGREGLLLVFLDSKEREKRLQRKSFDVVIESPVVETLLDDRVRRIRNASLDPNAGGVSPEELKGLAEARTAQYGSLARYASSLLLLLAVLGTFAGIKVALPDLIRAIPSAANSVADGSSKELTQSLTAVAEAFGGNALALIGAIAVGLMAQGISFGRRHLLERLELISTEYVYAQSVTSDANPMQAAMHALRDTADKMQAASGAMLGIEGQLHDLGREFRTAFDGLGDKIRDIAVGQDEALHDKTSQSLEQLERRVLDLADSMEANARTYAGLAEGVKNRSQEASRAFDTLSESNKQLASALESIVRTGEQSRTSVEELSRAVDLLTKGTASINANVQTVSEVTKAIAPAMSQVEQSLSRVELRFSEAERVSQDGWRQVGRELSDRLAAQANRSMATGRESSFGSEGFSSSGVSAILDGLRRFETPEPPSLWRQAAGPFIGVVVGSVLVSLATRYLV